MHKAGRRDNLNCRKAAGCRWHWFGKDREEGSCVTPCGDEQRGPKGGVNSWEDKW